MWLCVCEELLWRLEVLHSLVSELSKCMAGRENSVIEGTLQCSPGQPKSLHQHQRTAPVTAMDRFCRWWKAFAWVNKPASCLLWGTFGQENNSKRTCFLLPILSHCLSTVLLVRRNQMTWKELNGPGRPLLSSKPPCANLTHTTVGRDSVWECETCS